MTTIALKTTDLELTTSAQAKMAELFSQVEEDIEGVRVFATPGGCSGISFGMTFTDQLNANDGLLEFDDFKVIVDETTLTHLQGAEIDFADNGNGDASFVFNNLPQAESAGGCGTCGSSGGGCG